MVDVSSSCVELALEVIPMVLKIIGIVELP